MGKCPKCKAGFSNTKAGYKAYQKHYYEMHVPKNMKAKKGKDLVYKEPGFVKLMKKRRK